MRLSENKEMREFTGDQDQEDERPGCWMAHPLGWEFTYDRDTLNKASVSLSRVLCFLCFSVAKTDG